MPRKSFLSLAILLSLAPVIAAAAPRDGRRHVYHWHGYGFLPGYHQPPDNGVPIYSRTSSGHGAPYGAPYGASDGTAIYTPRYWYGGNWYYFGNPGFFHGRYNGGSFGPCWTWTPIGSMWNCG